MPLSVTKVDHPLFHRSLLNSITDWNILKTDSTANVSCEFSEDFQNFCHISASAIETFSVKVIGDIFIFYNFVEDSSKCIGKFRKAALLQISNNLQVGCSVTKNELQTKFLRRVLKILEYVPEDLHNGVLF